VLRALRSGRTIIGSPVLLLGSEATRVSDYGRSETSLLRRTSSRLLSWVRCAMQNSTRSATLMAACSSALMSQTPDSTRVSRRIIGIFDARTGAPLRGVQVRDVFSGTAVATTATGTAPLSFLTFRGSAAVVELAKLGYQAKQIIVTRADTASITEVMEPYVELAFGGAPVRMRRRSGLPNTG